MKRPLGLALAAALLCVAPSQADAQSVTGIAQCLIATSASVSCGSGSSNLAFIVNNTLVVQTVTVTCVWSGGSLEIPLLGALQVVTFANGPFYGLPFTGPMTCTPSGTPAGVVNAGDGIQLFWARR